jgi:hypothetical protein
MRQRTLRYLAEIDRARFLLPHFIEVPPARHDLLRAVLRAGHRGGMSTIGAALALRELASGARE